jgi:hypothetical protein
MIQMKFADLQVKCVTVLGLKTIQIPPVWNNYEEQMELTRMAANIDRSKLVPGRVYRLGDIVK